MVIYKKSFSNIKLKTKLIKELKKSRKMPGFKEILIPGEHAYKNKAKCLKQGWLDVDEKIVNKIDELLSTF